MRDQIGYGDGKTRKQHHRRSKESVNVGEISFNDDLLRLDTEEQANIPI